MASSKIINTPSHYTKRVKTSDYANASVKDVPHNVKVTDPTQTIRIKDVKSNTADIIAQTVNTKVSDFLPFRVRFINIGIQSYGPNNPAPIGIAIIGTNNYIL